MKKSKKRRINKSARQATITPKANRPQAEPANEQTLTLQQAIELAVQYHTAGNIDQARDIYQKVLAADPNHAVALQLSGLVAHTLGKNEEAIEYFSKAIAILPDYVDAHSNLGLVYFARGDMKLAAESFKKALSLNPNMTEAHSNLAAAFQKLGQLDEAIDSCRKAISLKPDMGKAHNNLGNVLRDVGDLDGSINSYRNALAADPANVSACDNLLLTEHYRPGHDAQSLFNLHLDWELRYAQQLKAAWPVHTNDRNPDRRIRVGLVSPDLGNHPVGYFVVGLLEKLQGSSIETICYSDRNEDWLTERIKTASSGWRDTRGIPDSDLPGRIMADEIDILIDLSGHSAGNRLPVFACKPAPVQVAWAGYVGTTGLSAIDYLISDIHSTPVEDEPYYSEKIIRMPDGWLCYTPPAYAPDVGALPSTTGEGVTFGSFNNPVKLNEGVISLWARVLQAVEGSKLLIKFRGIDSAANTNRLTTMFEVAGIDRSRLILEGGSPHEELLQRYNDVDIALDPFPYSGGLTTYEALWMGVPVITVPGKTFASRHSQSHLMTLGLPELVARDENHYVELAAELAQGTERLAGLRSGLRDMMAASPVCDKQKFADGFSTLMRDIWQDWCQAES